MRIEGIVISCYKADYELACICVASIRHWYPDKPIWLIKDYQYGYFDTGALEKYYDVKIYPTKHRSLGWGFGKLEVIIAPPVNRLLLIDADIVFAGRLLDRLEQYDEDLVVEKSELDSEGIGKCYYSIKGLQKIDPQFIEPGWGFNTGQIVITAGVIKRSDFDGLADWTKRTVIHSDVFRLAEQGMLNYIVQKKLQEGKLTLVRDKFMLWPGEEVNTAHIKLEDFASEGSHRELIHWAGLRWGKTIQQMPRADILNFFLREYQARVPHKKSAALFSNIKTAFLNTLYGLEKRFKVTHKD